MFKAALRYFALALALTATFTVKAVLESGKWVFRSVRDCLRPPVGAGAGIEVEMEDLAGEAHQIAAAAQAPVAANDDAADGLMKLFPEPEYDPSTDWGLIAKGFMRARACGQEEPSLTTLDEKTEGWLRSLTVNECLRLYNNPPRRIAHHIFGMHLFRGIAPCHRNEMPALLLADVEKPDPINQERLDDLESDPDLVPGYRALRVA